jgi:hypothetical protein
MTLLEDAATHRALATAQLMRRQAEEKRRKDRGNDRAGPQGRQVGCRPSRFILVFVSSYFSFISYINYAFRLDEKKLKK